MNDGENSGLGRGTGGSTTWTLGLEARRIPNGSEVRVRGVGLIAHTITVYAREDNPVVIFRSLRSSEDGALGSGRHWEVPAAAMAKGTVDSVGEEGMFGGRGKFATNRGVLAIFANGTPPSSRDQAGVDVEHGGGDVAEFLVEEIRIADGDTRSKPGEEVLGRRRRGRRLLASRQGIEQALGNLGDRDRLAERRARGDSGGLSLSRSLRRRLTKVRLELCHLLGNGRNGFLERNHS